MAAAPWTEEEEIEEEEGAGALSQFSFHVTSKVSGDRDLWLVDLSDGAVKHYVAREVPADATTKYDRDELFEKKIPRLRHLNEDELGTLRRVTMALRGVDSPSGTTIATLLANAPSHNYMYTVDVPAQDVRYKWPDNYPNPPVDGSLGPGLANLELRNIPLILNERNLVAEAGLGSVAGTSRAWATTCPNSWDRVIHTIEDMDNHQKNRLRICLATGVVIRESLAPDGQWKLLRRYTLHQKLLHSLADILRYFESHPDQVKVWSNLGATWTLGRRSGTVGTHRIDNPLMHAYLLTLDFADGQTVLQWRSDDPKFGYYEAEASGTMTPRNWLSKRLDQVLQAK